MGWADEKCAKVQVFSFLEQTLIEFHILNTSPRISKFKENKLKNATAFRL